MRDHEPTTPPDPRISVMTWLLDVGHAIRRKIRAVPASPMVRIHGR